MTIEERYDVTSRGSCFVFSMA